MFLLIKLINLNLKIFLHKIKFIFGFYYSNLNFLANFYAKIRFLVITNKIEKIRV